MCSSRNSLTAVTLLSAQTFTWIPLKASSCVSTLSRFFPLGDFTSSSLSCKNPKCFGEILQAHYQPFIGWNNLGVNSAVTNWSLNGQRKKQLKPSAAELSCKQTADLGSDRRRTDHLAFQQISQEETSCSEHRWIIMQIWSNECVGGALRLTEGSLNQTGTRRIIIRQNLFMPRYTQI